MTAKHDKPFGIECERNSADLHRFACRREFPAVLPGIRQRIVQRLVDRIRQVNLHAPADFELPCRYLNGGLSGRSRCGRQRNCRLNRSTERRRFRQFRQFDADNRRAFWNRNRIVASPCAGGKLRRSLIDRNGIRLHLRNDHQRVIGFRSELNSCRARSPVVGALIEPHSAEIPDPDRIILRDDVRE